LKKRGNLGRKNPPTPSFGKGGRFYKGGLRGIEKEGDHEGVDGD